jgi:invasion protein IalB
VLDAQQRKSLDDMQSMAVPPDTSRSYPSLVYSPWTKFCLKSQEAKAKEVCFTGKDGRVEPGMSVVAAVVIRPAGDEKIILRVTLPLGVQNQLGTKVVLDRDQPMKAPYIVCLANGCLADYDSNTELIGRLKNSQRMVVKGINGQGQEVSLSLPLDDFAKAYDGPPTDPKLFETRRPAAGGGAVSIIRSIQCHHCRRAPPTAPAGIFQPVCDSGIFRRAASATKVQIPCFAPFCSLWLC